MIIQVTQAKKPDVSGLEAGGVTPAFCWGMTGLSWEIHAHITQHACEGVPFYGTTWAFYSRACYYVHKHLACIEFFFHMGKVKNEFFNRGRPMKRG